MRKIEDFIITHGFELIVASFFVGMACGVVRILIA